MLSSQDFPLPNAKLITSSPIQPFRPSSTPSFLITSTTIYNHGKGSNRIHTGLTENSTKITQVVEDLMISKRKRETDGVSGRDLYQFKSRVKKTRNDVKSVDNPKTTVSKATPGKTTSKISAITDTIKKAHVGLQHRRHLEMIADEGSTSEEDDLDTITMADRYFDQTSRNLKTSNNTLENMPRLSHAEYQKLLRKPGKFSNFVNKHQQEIQGLIKAHEGQFSSWKFELNHFNLCFHGVGSKRILLNSFGQYCSNQMFPLLIVNGHLPTINVKQILEKIMEICLANVTCSRVSDMIDKLQQFFNNYNSHFYLVINGIDSQPLRSHQTQLLLSTLATFKNFHLICSVDHRNVALLWDNGMIERFKFLWHDLTTFLPYSTETSFINSDLIEGYQTKNTCLGAMYVLKSVSIQARKLFLILSRHQLSDKQVMTRQAFYRKCLDEFLVSSETTFNTQIREFKDHHLIQENKTVDGHLIFIPMTKEELEKVVESIQ